MAAAAANMKPRASMPTTASTEPAGRCAVSRSTQPARSRASASTGVMSLNWMPGWGKSGILRMARCRSAGVIFGSVMELGADKTRLLSHRFEFLDHFAEFGQRDVLDLPDAFARHAEFLADLLQGFFAPAIETKTVTEDGRLARIEGLDHLLQHGADGLFLQLLVGRRRVFVLHHFGKVVGILV